MFRFNLDNKEKEVLFKDSALLIITLLGCLKLKLNYIDIYN